MPTDNPTGPTDITATAEETATAPPPPTDLSTFQAQLAAVQSETGKIAAHHFQRAREHANVSAAPSSVGVTPLPAIPTLTVTGSIATGKNLGDYREFQV